MLKLRPSFRGLAIAAYALLALSIVLLPWYELGDYVPNGWDATFWARAALILALIQILLLRARAGPVIAVGGVIVLFIAFRVALPPDFGFDFNGLSVDVTRRVGSWVGLGLALVGAVLTYLAVRAHPAAAPPPPVPQPAAPAAQHPTPAAPPPQPTPAPQSPPPPPAPGT
jgi:hypothetical protein